jgi:hypothetical protein
MAIKMHSVALRLFWISRSYSEWRLTTEARGSVIRMPQTIIIEAVIVIGLLFLAIGGCYFAQGRKRMQLADRTGPDDRQR